MELSEVLLWVISGGGGAVVTWLMSNVQALANLAPDYKRYVSWLLSAVVPLAAWGAMLGLGYEPIPASWQAAAERVFALVFIAFSTNQGLHAVTELRRKRLAMS